MSLKFGFALLENHSHNCVFFIPKVQELVDVFSANFFSRISIVVSNPISFSLHTSVYSRFIHQQQQLTVAVVLKCGEWISLRGLKNSLGKLFTLKNNLERLKYPLIKRLGQQVWINFPKGRQFPLLNVKLLALVRLFYKFSFLHPQSLYLCKDNHQLIFYCI